MLHYGAELWELDKASHFQGGVRGVKETVRTVHSRADGQSSLLTQFITSRMSARLSGRPRMGKPANLWSLQTKLQSTSGRLAQNED